MLQRQDNEFERNQLPPSQILKSETPGHPMAWREEKIANTVLPGGEAVFVQAEKGMKVVLSPKKVQFPNDTPLPRPSHRAQKAAMTCTQRKTQVLLNQQVRAGGSGEETHPGGPTEVGDTGQHRGQKEGIWNRRTWLCHVHICLCQVL